ncbi:poly(A) polymerase [Pseudoxanthobacter soli DSM 19599]|uniref:Poly(A) polymerase n=1 Tax=Pseudoxanthobacter soli DSM 19599 TaxID=1123029 RepID=A0A1M7ZBY3_9HYPH|nr:CCA tRNA nucleotidyltransferase [Pseudoxanthobacter soli]SHO62408.1 poly(A) polymerase [Pseudoxanthobacter soli DSM 19599]
MNPAGVNPAGMSPVAPGGPPSLGDAPWLADPATQRLLATLGADGEEARIVGGAVRNALIGEPVEDIDIATTALPEEVMRRARAAGFKAVPTGVEHGTVTVVAGGRPFEVTTLRRDVATDGRRAEVAFGRDWDVDARRRDFTMNALYVDAGGTLFDPVGGYGDCLARRVRFIGDPDRRIAEDYLRILRFFRFCARYGRGEPDGDGLAAAVRGRAGLRRLSAERIAAEMTKLVTACSAATVMPALSETGLLGRVLGGIGLPARFARVSALVPARSAARRLPPALGFVALGVLVAEDVDRLADRLKLANALRGAMAALVGAQVALGARKAGLGPVDSAAVRRLVHGFGADAAEGALLLAAADCGCDADAGHLAALLAVARGWQAPSFPVSGADLAALGIPPGRGMGERLAALKSAWIASDFTLDKAALIARVENPPG